jgi:hypothetical protein
MVLFECNNIAILSFIIIYLNYNEHVNSHKYMSDILKSRNIAWGYQLVFYYQRTIVNSATIKKVFTPVV